MSYMEKFNPPGKIIAAKAFLVVHILWYLHIWSFNAQQIKFIVVDARMSFCFIGLWFHEKRLSPRVVRVV